MTQAITRDNRGTVFGRTLGLESDGMEEPMMPGCVSIANCHEHTAGEGPLYFYQSCRKADWVSEELPAICSAIPGG